MIKIKEDEKIILQKSFDRVDISLAHLKEKKPFVENIEPGDFLFIDYNNSSKGSENIYRENYLGVVDKVVGLYITANTYDVSFIGVDFRKGRCKTLRRSEETPYFCSSEHEGVRIYPHARLHKGKDVIEQVLQKKYNTSLKEIGLE